MKTFEQRLSERRRLIVLQILKGQPGYSLNSSNLHAGLEHYSVHSTRASLLDDLRWLARQGLVKLESLADIQDLYKVTLTHGGHDVARGVDFVTGVERPDPD